MASEISRALKWAKEELQCFLREFHGNTSKDGDMLLVNMKSLGISFLGEMNKNQISFAPGKSLMSAFNTGNAYLFTIPRFEETRDKLLRIRYANLEISRGKSKPEKKNNKIHYTFDEGARMAAIKEFCKQDPYSIFHPWVLEQIVRLRRRNSIKSLKQIDEIIKAYTGRDSKTKTEKLYEKINLWWNCIYPEILEMEQKAQSLWKKRREQRDWAYGEVESKFKASFDSIKRNRPVLKKIQELVDQARSAVIWHLASYHSVDDASHLTWYKDRFHPVIEEIFIGVDKIGWELAIYKKIREKYVGKVYQEGRWNLRWKSVWGTCWSLVPLNGPTDFQYRSRDQISNRRHEFSKVPLIDLLKRSRTDLPFQELKGLYRTYRLREAGINLENLFWICESQEEEMSRIANGELRQMVKERDETILIEDGFYE